MVAKADTSMLIYPVAKLNEFGPQLSILKNELVERLNTAFPGKIQSEWDAKVLLGENFDPSECKFKDGLKPRSHKFVVY